MKNEAHSGRGGLRPRIPLTLLAALLLAVVVTVRGAGASGASTAGASAVPAPVAAYQLQATWHSRGASGATTNWRQPAGVDIDAAGNIYVSDAGGGTITRIDPAGQPRAFLADPGQTGTPEAVLSAPTHLAVDDTRRRLYVVDTGTGTIEVFGLDDGRHLASWGGVATPAGVAVGPDGTVFASSADTGEVVGFHADGAIASRWLVPQAKATNPPLLAGLAASASGEVVVIAGSGRTAYTLSPTGQVADRSSLDLVTADVALEEGPKGNSRRLWLATVGGIARLNPALRFSELNNSVRNVLALALSPRTGLVAVVGPRGNAPGSVMAFKYGTVTGGPERQWGGGPGASILGSLRDPAGIQMTADGRLVVLDQSGSLGWWSSDGQPLAAFAGRTAVVDADGAADGTLFAIDSTSIYAFKGAQGPALWERPLSADMAGLVAVGYAPGADQVLVLDAAKGMVWILRADGSPVGQVSLPLAAPGRRASWNDLAVASDGAFMALDRRGPGVAYAPAGQTARPLTLPAPGARISLDHDGTALYVLGQDGWVRRFTLPPGGAASDQPVGVLDGAFDATRFDAAVRTEPSDLTVDDLGRVYVTDLDAAIVSVFGPAAGATISPPSDDPTACRNYPDKTAAPGEIWLGETVDVQLTLRGGCGRDLAMAPLDVMLVMDRSRSMEGEKIQLAEQAAVDFVTQMDPALTQIGLVSFDSQATLEQALTFDQDAVLAAIRGLRVGLGTAIDAGLKLARTELTRHRRMTAQPVVILLTDGENNAGPQPVLTEAAALKAAGVEIFTIDIQGNAAVLRQAATDEEHYFEVESARYLPRVFDTIARRISTATLYKTITVIDRIPANMRYVDGSAQPPAAFDAAANALTWTLRDVPFRGFGLRYRLEPLEVGRWPTNIVAWGDYTDGLGRAGKVDFPVPVVVVKAPAMPQPTPTPTDTPTPTPTPSPSPTPTPTPTPTPRPIVPIYLPISLREHCTPGERHADVMLVIDASNSMIGAKLAGAQAAAKQFYSLLRLPEDQVGVVSFNSTATLVSPLTGNPTSLDAAIDALTNSPGTYIDKGLQLAADELAGPRHQPDHTPVIVLLTDGIQTGDPAPAQAIAAAARARGVVIFAIGLGADVDVTFLWEAAGEATRVYLAPSENELAAIYAAIAVVIPCPADAYWGRRVGAGG